MHTARCSAVVVLEGSSIDEALKTADDVIGGNNCCTHSLIDGESGGMSVDLNIEELIQNMLVEEPSERLEEHSSHQNIDVTAIDEYRFDSKEEYHCKTRLYRAKNPSNVI